jgi:magnesium-transporting ATPase (P-type)
VYLGACGAFSLSNSQTLWISCVANVIRDGVDPHAFTAAMFEGIPLKDFLKLKHSPRSAERKRFSRLRFVSMCVCVYVCMCVCVYMYM